MNFNPYLENFKIEFREFCVFYYIKQIDEWFTEAGFKKLDPQCITRRDQVDGYYNKIDWNKQDDIEKFLKVIEYVLRTSSYNVSNETKDYLRALCNKCGLEVDSNGYTIYLTNKSSHTDVKNIIFASNYLKPEIIFSDSLNNDIEMIKNQEYCLVYDQPIHSHGLLWIELIEWWKKDQKIISWSNSEAGDHLYKRLKESFKDNEAEIRLFDTYYTKVCTRLGNNSPALLPQVYLHYDPYTIKELKRMNKKQRLKRQRMDFLLLLPKSKRIVIEIDGKQHYSDDKGLADTKRYSEMIMEDRRLKFLGYEVYRFGGYEIMQNNYENIILDFFQKMLDFYELNLDF
ncbi:DUF559 domain-containing protein [Crocosphaera chwakensis]|uniref:DUF559 domain-containing protein n=1 Tax=Crocosphaera chwakensis CCY0110 TaxID=391612 RepID=A3ILN7_9CHRO|nr:DUF559 domain-containing protein [Crocosphaera chwakensis]EAZ92688.1 hypothetical protein CY0110_24016 [Crocosphaera chwakensis CCY0110]